MVVPYGNKDVTLEIMVLVQVLLGTLIFICRAGKGQGKVVNLSIS